MIIYQRLSINKLKHYGLEVHRFGWQTKKSAKFVKVNLQHKFSQINL